MVACGLMLVGGAGIASAQDVPRLIVKFLLFALLIPPRRKNVRSMLAGLRAGIAGRAAPPPDVD